MDLISAFGLLHSRVHAGEVYDRPSLADRVFGDLTDAEMRARPATGVNSLVWLLWHMARTEDSAVNHVVAATAQVLDDQWARRMNVPARVIGTGMTDDEVVEITRRADVAAVRAYRVAVGRRTRDVVRSLRPEQWDVIQTDDDIARAAAEGAYGPNRAAFRAFARHPYVGLSHGTQLFVSGADHNARHIGEAITIRGLGGFGLAM
jgi:hypothetical protein